MISINNKEKKVKQDFTRVKIKRTVTQHTYTKKWLEPIKFYLCFTRNKIILSTTFKQL